MLDTDDYYSKLFNWSELINNCSSDFHSALNKECLSKCFSSLATCFNTINQEQLEFSSYADIIQKAEKLLDIFCSYLGFTHCKYQSQIHELYYIALHNNCCFSKVYLLTGLCFAILKHNTNLHNGQLQLNKTHSTSVESLGQCDHKTIDTLKQAPTNTDQRIDSSKSHSTQNTNDQPTTVISGSCNFYNNVANDIYNYRSMDANKYYLQHLNYFLSTVQAPLQSLFMRHYAYRCYDSIRNLNPVDDDNINKFAFNNCERCIEHLTRFTFYSSEPHLAHEQRTQLEYVCHDFAKLYFSSSGSFRNLVDKCVPQFLQLIATYETTVNIDLSFDLFVKYVPADAAFISLTNIIQISNEKSCNIDKITFLSEKITTIIDASPDEFKHNDNLNSYSDRVKDSLTTIDSIIDVLPSKITDMLVGQTDNIAFYLSFKTIILLITVSVPYNLRNLEKIAAIMPLIRHDIKEIRQFQPLTNDRKLNQQELLSLWNSFTEQNINVELFKQIGRTINVAVNYHGLSSSYVCNVIKFLLQQIQNKEYSQVFVEQCLNIKYNGASFKHIEEYLDVLKNHITNQTQIDNLVNLLTSLSTLNTFRKAELYKLMFRFYVEVNSRSVDFSEFCIALAKGIVKVLTENLQNLTHNQELVNAANAENEKTKIDINSDIKDHTTSELNSQDDMLNDLYQTPTELPTTDFSSSPKAVDNNYLGNASACPNKSDKDAAAIPQAKATSTNDADKLNIISESELSKEKLAEIEAKKLPELSEEDVKEFIKITSSLVKYLDDKQPESSLRLAFTIGAISFDYDFVNVSINMLSRAILCFENSIINTNSEYSCLTYLVEGISKRLNNIPIENYEQFIDRLATRGHKVLSEEHRCRILLLCSAAYDQRCLKNKSTMCKKKCIEVLKEAIFLTRELIDEFTNIFKQDPKVDQEMLDDIYKIREKF